MDGWMAPPQHSLLWHVPPYTLSRFMGLICRQRSTELYPSSGQTRHTRHALSIHPLARRESFVRFLRIRHQSRQEVIRTRQTVTQRCRAEWQKESIMNFPLPLPGNVWAELCYLQTTTVEYIVLYYYYISSYAEGGWVGPLSVCICYFRQPNLLSKPGNQKEEMSKEETLYRQSP